MLNEWFESKIKDTEFLDNTVVVAFVIGCFALFVIFIMFGEGITGNNNISCILSTPL